MAVAVRIHSDQGGGEGGLDPAVLGGFQTRVRRLFFVPDDDIEEAVVIEIKQADAVVLAIGGAQGLAGERFWSRRSWASWKLRNLTLAPCWCGVSTRLASCSPRIHPCGWKIMVKVPCLRTVASSAAFQSATVTALVAPWAW